ncbi:SOS response-associated peptidase [Microcoleus sp. FACHB-SPT15]|uniref:SOS response-associated peptidase n=1 Tax=Microcoleus sp. FACHB-SPT15 TaxID=2692830 RepID=UPI00177CEE8E|nr:SOS response-associated peptidase [Microcoleus sp. FACHB-SPT15]MBD1804571.1 SOS response-associated peptidase [Microcoleus sp. FACHB-SPT15]
MCGRYTQSKSAEIITRAFQLDNVSDIEPRYNIAPTQSVLTVLQPSASANRQGKMLHWGLIPSWAKDRKMASKLINARAETVAEKPAFRSAFRKRRCLVVADGFYEWQQQENKKQKQPFYFRLSDGEPFAFAGLWEQWQDATGEEIESCTVLTTEANDLMRPIHNRMPVILEPKNYDLWLDAEATKPELLQLLLHPYPTEEMTAYPVSTAVNKPTNDSAECINSI